MKGEMYIPGQDDFPGWDEFYSPRRAARSRMRYSFKTLLLMPPLVAVVIFMYLLGYHKGNSDEEQLKAAIQTQSRSLRAAAITAQDNVNRVAEKLQSAELAQREFHLSMTTLTTLVDQLQLMPDAPGNTEAVRREVYDTTAEGLKQLELALKNANAQDHATIWSHLELARAYLVLSKSVETATADARAQFQAAQDDARSVVQLHPQDAEAQRDLLVSDSALGAIHRDSGFTSAARDDFLDAVEMSRKLLRAERQSGTARRTLSVMLSNLADMYLQLGEAAQARDAYDEALQIGLSLAEDDPKDIESQRDLFQVYGGLGDAYLRSIAGVVAGDDHPPGADARRALAVIGPEAIGSRYDRFVTYKTLADGNRQPNDLAAAREAFRKSLEIAQKLANDDQPSRRSQTDLAHSLSRLGYLEMTAENFPAAAKSFKQGIAILESTGSDRDANSSSPAAGLLEDDRDKLGACETVSRAVDDLDFLLRQPRPQRQRLLGLRSRALARQGRQSDAAATADRLCVFEPASGSAVFDAAEAYALCAANDRPTEVPAAKAADATRAANRSAERAVELLEKARRAGYFNTLTSASTVLANHNLDALAAREDFAKLLADLDSDAAERRTAK
jgi:tetratricopeptide (TPR) repeat protein